MTYTWLNENTGICYVWGPDVKGNSPTEHSYDELTSTLYDTQKNQIKKVCLIESGQPFDIPDHAFSDCDNLWNIYTAKTVSNINFNFGLNDGAEGYNVKHFGFKSFANNSLSQYLEFTFKCNSAQTIEFDSQAFNGVHQMDFDIVIPNGYVRFGPAVFNNVGRVNNFGIEANYIIYDTDFSTDTDWLVDKHVIRLNKIKQNLKLLLSYANPIRNGVLEEDIIDATIISAAADEEMPQTMEFSFPNKLIYGIKRINDYVSSTTQLIIHGHLDQWRQDNITTNQSFNEDYTRLQNIKFADDFDWGNKLDLFDLNNFGLADLRDPYRSITIEGISVENWLKHVISFKSQRGLGVIIQDENSNIVQTISCKVDNVSKIQDYAFAQCNDLKTIIITDNINTIGYKAFYKCSGIRELRYDCANCQGFNKTEGNQIFSYLGHSAPNGCVLKIGPNVINIPVAFMYPEALDIHNPGLGTYPKIQDIQICDKEWNVLSDTSKNTKLTTIGTAAFKYVNRSAWPDNNWTLTNFFEYCNNLKILGSSAFAGVHSITELYFPDNLVEIGDNCFNECTKLTAIVNSFPASLITMHPRAFGEIRAYNKAFFNKDFQFDTEKKNKGSCDLLLCDKIEGDNNYDGYMIYILDSDDQAWLLHHYQVQTEAGVGSYVVGLPSKYKVYGISEKALRTTYDNTYEYGRCNFYITNDNNQVFQCEKGEYSPRVIGTEAFESIAFVNNKPKQPIIFNLTETIYLGNRAFTKHKEQLSSSIMWQYNISLVPAQTQHFCINGLELNNQTVLNFTTKMSLFYWLFNSTFIKSLNALPDETITGTIGAWQLAIEDGKIEYIVIEQTEEQNDVLCQEKTVTIKCKDRQKLNTYSLFETKTSYCIDMGVCDISNAYIFGPYNCFKHTDANSTEEKLSIQLLNGYINNGYDLYKNNNTVFYNPDRKHLCVQEFNVPYYVITKWFKQVIYATKSLTHYVIYGGNTEEDDLQLSSLRIYNKSLKSLSLPLTNNTESLIKPSNRILHTWGPSSEEYNFSSLETFKLTAPINKNRTNLYLPSQSLKAATALTEVELDSRLTHIGEEAFVGSNNIESIKLVGPDTLTLKDWYNIAFTSITSSPFYSIEWNSDKNNCKLYINDTEQHLPVVEIGEKENYVIQNDNDVKYIKYDPKPFYNYPIRGLIFQECFKGEFQDQDLTDMRIYLQNKDLTAEPIKPLDMTDTLGTIQFNKMPANEYSVLNNIFRAKTEIINEEDNCIKYPNLTKILLDNSIINLPAGCFENLLNDDKNYANYFSSIYIGLSNQLEALGEHSFYNCNCFVGEYDGTQKEVVSAKFEKLKLANNTGLGMGLIANSLYLDETNNATYYSATTGFLLKCEPTADKTIDLSTMQIIDLKAIKYNIDSLSQLIIPWLGTCGDAAYIPPDQYSALKNWFDIEDTQIVNIDTLCIQNSQGIHGFNPSGTKIPVFQNIKIDHLEIKAPTSQPIAKVPHFDDSNASLTSILLQMNEIPTNLLLDNTKLVNNKSDLSQIDILHIEPYTSGSQIIIHNDALCTSTIKQIIINSQYNQFEKNVFNDNLINDYIYYCNPLKDWVRYNSFGNEKSNPIRFSRKFYTNYTDESNKGGIERILQPDSELQDGEYHFYVNSYSLYNNHQVNTIICTNVNATSENQYKLYDSFIAAPPIAPLRSNALIELIADTEHNAIMGLTNDDNEPYAKQCFKAGISSSEVQEVVI